MSFEVYVQYEAGTAPASAAPPFNSRWSDELCLQIIAMEAALMEEWKRQVEERQNAPQKKGRRR